MPDPVVWLNPACSKCRTVQGILTEHGIEATYLDDLHEPPTVAELRRVLEMLGTTEPRAIAAAARRSAAWVSAWGKFPRCSPVPGSISSAYRLSGPPRVTIASNT